MDAQRWKALRAVFEEAAELQGDARARLLDERCAGDDSLRGEVEGMLAVGDSPDFLDPPARDVAVPAARAAALPERFGSYRVVRTLGSGGMGDVYEAEQDEPRRRVALKVMRFGLYSPASVRRFRYESELLGRLRHPGIAQVHEAGVERDERTGTETPWFAMEYVESARDVARYAREERLDVDAKLALFSDVCDAVHHGHQRGVVHRDLKPANVLVDGAGRVKVIDFGVARTTDVDLAAHTLATRTGELIGTLHYMSPEQLAGDPSEVDTRSDVYSLGVVLYEIVCGRLPHDLVGESLLGIAHKVQEEPPRPLPRTLPEDLGWVLMRALEKDKERRYGTAAELGAELRRILANEPVLAGRPSAVYRLRKLARRHRVGVAAVLIVSAALLTGGAIAAGGLVRAAGEAHKFRTTFEVWNETLLSALPERDGADARVSDMLDAASARLTEDARIEPLVRAALHDSLAQSYLGLGKAVDAEREARAGLALREGRTGLSAEERLAGAVFLAQALRQQDAFEDVRAVAAVEAPRAARALGAAHPVALSLAGLEAFARFRLGEVSPACADLDRLLTHAATEHGDAAPVTRELMLYRLESHRELLEWESATALARRRYDATRAEYGAEDYRALDAELTLAAMLRAHGDLVGAEERFEHALEPLLALAGDDHPRSLSARGSYAQLRDALGHRHEAVSLMTEVAQAYEQIYGPDHEATLLWRHNIGLIRSELGDELAGLEALMSELETRRRVFGEDHLGTATTENNLAIVLIGQRRTDDAEPLLQHALEVRRAALGDDHRLTLASIETLGYLHYTRRDWEACAALFREARDGFARELGRSAPQSLRAGANLVVALGRLERYSEAIVMAEEGLAAHREVLPAGAPQLVSMRKNLAELNRRNGNLMRAEDMLRELVEETREALAAGDVPALQTLDRLAQVVRERGRTSDALQLFNEALEAWPDDPGPHRGSYALTRWRRGQCLRELERFEPAERDLALAWEILAPAAQPGDTAPAEILAELVELCEAWGRDDLADEWRARRSQ